jgi:hypothetical protein
MMALYKDWFGGSRTEQLFMGKNWIFILQSIASSQPGTTVAALWNISDEAVLELVTLVTAAESALGIAQNEETRTPVATTRCKVAFEAMAAAMRDMKKRWFYVPPLQPEDLIALGLKIPDSSSSSTGIPTAQVTVESYLVGRHELGVKIIYVTGNASAPANKGYRIWYTVVAPGEPAPTNPDDLRKSFYTKRKKDVIGFDFGDSGKTAWFAVQIENEGKKGPWGPLVSALIP